MSPLLPTSKNCFNTTQDLPNDLSLIFKAKEEFLFVFGGFNTHGF
jgi:hypothetical protein